MLALAIWIAVGTDGKVYWRSYDETSGLVELDVLGGTFTSGPTAPRSLTDASICWLP